MKTEFSTSWISSKQPRKQRKYRYNAPLHVRHNFLSAHLSKELRGKHKTRNMPVRKGDEVLVMRGAFAGKKAKVSAVDSKSGKITLEGLTRAKRDGSKTAVKFEPSKMQIIALHGEDKERMAKSKTTGEKKNAPNKSTNN